MTINELCKQYNRNESSIRQKFARSKARLEGHITISPYSKTISLDDYAVRYLLEDKRSRNRTQSAPEPPVTTSKALETEIKNNADMFLYWSDEKKQRVMDICLEEVKKHYDALDDIPDSFKTYELCQRAVENQGVSLQFVPTRFITEELCNIAVRENSIALIYVPDEFKSEKMIQTAFDNYKDCFNRIKGDLSFKERDKAWQLLKYVPEVFRTRDICFKAISKSDSNAQYVPPEYIDEEFINKMIDSPVSREYIPLNYWTKTKIIETLKKDKETKYQEKFGLNGFPKEIFNYTFFLELVKSEIVDLADICGNEKFASILTKAERESIRNIDLERYYDHERIYEKIREDGNNIRMLSLDDPKYNYYSMVAVCSCGKTLRYIPMEKRDYRMCCAAVEDDPEAMLYVPDEYKERVVKDIRSRNHWIKYIFENDFLADMLIK